MVRIFQIIISVFLFSLNVNGQNYSVSKVEMELNGSAYSPTFLNTSVVFCSDHKDRVFHTIVDENGHEPVDLYQLNLDSSKNKFSEV